MISIIIPLYNKAESISRTIESVLKQTYTDFELIIVDDGSTDNSKNTVKEFKDFRIRYECKSNGGVSSARNYGAKVAKSEWLFFLDADDLLLEDALKEIILCKNHHKITQVVISGFVIKQGEKQKCLYPYKKGKIRNPLKQWWLHSIFPRTGNFLISKRAFLSLGGFDERISYNEDFGFILKMLNTYEVACTHCLSMVYTDDYKTLSVKKTPIEVELGYYLSELSIESLYSNYFIYWQYVWTIQRRRMMGDINNMKIIQKEFDSRFSILDKIRNIVMQKYSVVYKLLHLKLND